MTPEELVIYELTQTVAELKKRIEDLEHEVVVLKKQLEDEEERRDNDWRGYDA